MGLVRGSASFPGFRRLLPPSFFSSPEPTEPREGWKPGHFDYCLRVGNDRGLDNTARGLYNEGMTEHERLLSVDLIIPLTDRPPVAIKQDDWPLIARAEAHVGTEDWYLLVRQHADGRCIAYGSHSTGVLGQYDQKAGVLIHPNGKSDRGYPLEVELRIISGDRLKAPPDLAQRCLADLPPEVI